MLAASATPRCRSSRARRSSPSRPRRPWPCSTAPASRSTRSGLAIACASHIGSDDHQIEAARILAEADLDESALRCPPALPEDLVTLLSISVVPTRWRTTAPASTPRWSSRSSRWAPIRRPTSTSTHPLQQAVARSFACWGEALLGPADRRLRGAGMDRAAAGLATGLRAARGRRGAATAACATRCGAPGPGRWRRLQDTALMRHGRSGGQARRRGSPRRRRRAPRAWGRSGSP